MKKCKDCKKTKDKSKFYGIQGECKDCTRIRVKKNRLANKIYYDAYDVERNRGNYKLICLRRYSSMLERIEGRATRPYAVEGRSICSKKEFLDWCKKTEKNFWKLHNIWKERNYSRRLCPTIDRINNNKGYSVDNLQWLPLHLNIKKDKKNDFWHKLKRNKKGQFTKINK